MFLGFKIIGSNFARLVEIKAPARPGDPTQGTQVIRLLEIGLKLPGGLVFFLDSGDDLICLEDRSPAGIRPRGAGFSGGFFSGTLFSGDLGWHGGARGRAGCMRPKKCEQRQEPKAKRLYPVKIQRGRPSHHRNTHQASQSPCPKRTGDSLKKTMIKNHTRGFS